ncbi:MAG: hypothetical protein ACI956_001662, partial [Nonlabens sp.]
QNPKAKARAVPPKRHKAMSPNRKYIFIVNMRVYYFICEILNLSQRYSFLRKRW